MKNLLRFWLLFLAATPAFAQGNVVTTGASNPKLFAGAATGACGPQDTAVNTITGDFYVCVAGAWHLAGGSGGGGGAFSAITAGTNAAALVVGTGGSLGTSGSGTIDATTLGAKTFASPAAIGTGTPAAATFTTVNASGQITSTLAIGTAPFAITSTTVVPNLNVAKLNGTTWTAPGTIGGTTPGDGHFAALDATGSVSSIADGVHPGAFEFAGNTTLPSLTASTVTLLGPPSATPTAWSLQLPTAIPTTGHLLDCTVSTTNCLLHDSGVVTANVVNASSPGAGVAHFAGSTQTVTSSAIVAADITSATITGTQLAASLALTTPNIGAATGTSLLATGLVDGTAPVIVTTGTTGTPGATYNHSYSFNEEATAGTGVNYTLPTAAAGKQYCIANAYNGSAPNTGVITITTSASGQFIIFTDGTLSASGGNITSGGAAGDAACVVGVDTTHWYLYVQSGTWTKH